ncbi:Uncharacterized protein FKW44_013815, partial [Caligus rogercresseyi]
GTMLFGVDTLQGIEADEVKSMNITLRGIKAYIARALTDGTQLETSSIRAIMIATSARYSTFSVKIPKICGQEWDFAGNLVKFFPSSSVRHLKTLNFIIQQYDKFTPRNS